MSIEAAILRRDALLTSVGKVALGAIFPEDFEIYMCALELTSAEDKTLEYFIFPVMPSSIREAQPKLTNIKKSAGGVTVLRTTTFVPREVTLSGNFGRKFKFLLGSSLEVLGAGFATVLRGGPAGRALLQQGVGEFDPKIKTGYGCCKVLQRLVDQASQLDGQQPRTLRFYNLALGNHYVVEPLDLTYAQSLESNMIWNYSLRLKAVAPVNIGGQRAQRSLATRLVIEDQFQKGVNNLINTLTNLI